MSPEDQPSEDFIKNRIDELYRQEANRRRAVDLAFAQFSQADSESDRMAALNNLKRMMGIHVEFRQGLESVFPDEDDD